MIKIRYTNAVDVGGISYYDNFTPEIYLDVDVGKPIYLYSEDGDEDVSGSFNRTFARLEKQYSINTYVQEYMLDALMLVQLHDYVEIYLSNGTSLVVKEFRVSDPEWNELDALAAITITLSVFEESVSSGCPTETGFTCDDMQNPVLNYERFINGTNTATLYLNYVVGEGGVIEDYEALEAYYEEIGAPAGDNPKLVFTGEATENTNNLLRIFDGDANLLYSKMFTANQINAGEFEIEVGGLVLTSIYPLLTTSRAGCTSLTSPAGVAVNICGSLVLEALFTDYSDAPILVLVLDPDSSSDGGLSEIDFYTQLVVDGTPESWEYNKTVDKFTAKNLELEITKEQESPPVNISVNIKAVSNTHVCSEEESNVVSLTLYTIV